MVDFFQDPITRLYSVISLLMLATMATIGYNFQQDEVTAETLHKDMLAHSADRFTRYDAKEVERAHAVEHLREEAASTRLNQALLSAALAVLEQEFNSKIVAIEIDQATTKTNLEKNIALLPRPPKHYVASTKAAFIELRKALALIDRRLYRIEDTLIPESGTK